MIQHAVAPPLRSGTSFETRLRRSSGRGGWGQMHNTSESGHWSALRFDGDVAVIASVSRSNPGEHRAALRSLDCFVASPLAMIPPERAVTAARRRPSADAGGARSRSRAPSNKLRPVISSWARPAPCASGACVPRPPSPSPCACCRCGANAFRATRLRRRGLSWASGGLGHLHGLSRAVGLSYGG